MPEPRVVAASAIAAAAASAAAIWYIRNKRSASAAEPAPEPTLRSAYRQSDWTIGEVYLDFDLHESCAVVACKLTLRRTAAAPAPLTLDGEELELLRLAVDGRALTAEEYSVGPDGRLTIVGSALSESCTLSSEVRVYPENNSQLSGLYKSGGMFCTQCEAEGFRRITYFLDRPDVMATFRVRVEAERERYPVLLSNGNKLAEGPTLGGRHYALWEDPFPKPCYLFALVAGDLGSIHGSHTTPDGRTVALGFYSEHKNVHKLGHGLHSLTAAMAWDERAFGLACDLSTFNVVAVEDFNMGAMENKGLNVFNTSCVLADPQSQTDDDFETVMGVVGHEYFHNWTGNRVTCRDWFQLTLKEGLTVYRDQQFSADMTSAVVKRIEDVRVLRAAQFPEDAGPMAHPIRPDSYIAMDNFYTATVYEKGAEVTRRRPRARRVTAAAFHRRVGPGVHATRCCSAPCNSAT